MAARTFVDHTGTLFHFAGQQPSIPLAPTHSPRPMLAGNVVNVAAQPRPMVATASHAIAPANHLGNGSYA